MSSVLQGAKSKLYLNKDPIPNVADIDANDSLQHVTAPEIAGNRVGMDVIIHGKYSIISSIAIAVGSVKRKIVITAHGLPIGKKGLFLKPLNGNAVGEEVSILSVIDINTIVIATELNMAIGDLVEISRYVTPNYSEDGDLNVVVNGSGPIEFNKDGVTTAVNYNTTTPSSSEALPVNIVTVNGQGISTTVDLSGAQINVQLTDRGTSPDAVKIGDGINFAGVNINNEIKTSDVSVLAAVNDCGLVSTGNSSTVALGANAVFTGTAIEIKDYSAIAVAAISNVASATNGLSMQFSPDGTNWDHSHSYTSPAATGVSYTQACELRYFRIVYTNGASAQAYFRLTVILKRNNTMPSRYTFDQGIVGSQLADNTKSVIHGVTTGGGGGYVPVKVNPSGALTVDATISSSALPTGAATSANQTTELTRLGDVVETPPATDTASSGLNGRLQRISQRLTSLIALFPISIGAKTSAGSLSVVIASDQGAIGSVQVSSSALPTGAAVSTTQTLQLAQETNINTALGVTADTVATTDTGTFSLIALTKKIAQNITNMSAKLPALGTQVAGSSLSITQASSTTFAVVEQARGAGSIVNTQKTVGLTQVRATVSGSAPSARRKLIMKPSKNNTGAIYYGATGVTTSSGLEIIGPDTVIFNNESDDYFLISDTAAQVVEILEVY